jgi:hypothetical protein
MSLQLEAVQVGRWFTPQSDAVGGGYCSVEAGDRSPDLVVESELDFLDGSEIYSLARQSRKLVRADSLRVHQERPLLRNSSLPVQAGRTVFQEMPSISSTDGRTPDAPFGESQIVASSVLAAATASRLRRFS